MLSDTKIRGAKRAARPYKLADGGGLYLFVSTSGGKVWRLKYRFGGKEKLLSLGRYPDVSLAAARAQRDEAKRNLRDGRDPSAVKKEQAEAAVVAASNTFEKVARAWFDVNKGQWTDTHASDVIGSLERDVFPDLGAVPIGEITPPRVLKVLRAIEARPAIETARRIRQRMSAVFVYGIASSLCETDPAALVQKALARPLKGRQPAITDLAKAREMLRTAESIPAHPVTKLGLRFLALTVVRPGIVCSTPWTELNAIDDETWCIPAERMKLRKERKNDDRYDFLVPLPRQALEVIEALRSLTGRCPYAFPNARHSHRPMSENAIGYLLNRAGYHHKHVPHGWRATFSTIMNERFKEDRHIIDLMLAHVPKDKVEGAYNRAAYLSRRRELAQIWADLLLEGMLPAHALLNGPRRPVIANPQPANVVSLARTAKS